MTGPLGSSNATYVNYIIVTNLPPLLSVSPTNGPFGQLLVSQSSTQSFQISNLGGQPLTGSVATVPPFFIASASNTFSVPPGLTGVVQVAFSPTNADSFTNNLVFTSNGGNQTNLLSGTAVTPGNIVVSPASTNFGVVLFGTNATATFAVTNTGGGLVSNGVASVGTGPFSIISGTNFSLAGFGSTNVVVRFTPPGDGTFSNNVIFTSSGGNRTNSISGVGQTPGQIAVNPASWDFGVVAVSANADRTFVVTNLGGAPVTGGSAAVSPPFSIVSGSPFTVASFGTTNVLVRFTPSGAGSISNSVRFTTANGGNVTNAVSGTGLMPAQLVVMPTSYNFGAVGTGTTAQVVFSVTNAGGAALSGTASVGAPFAIVSGSPFNLPGYGTTNLAVSFTPAAVGSFTNDLIFTSNGGGSTNRLTGTGISGQGPTFTQLGSAGGAYIPAEYLSPDGTVVVGTLYDITGRFLPVKWTRLDGWQYVGNFDGIVSTNDYTGANAADVSLNGRCIVGCFDYPSYNWDRWMFAAYTNGDFLVISNSVWYQMFVSRDGSRFAVDTTVDNVAGTYLISDRTNFQQLVPANFDRWFDTSLVGTSSNLNTLLFRGQFFDTSPPHPYGHTRTYVWRADTGIVNIGSMGGLEVTEPSAISGDGQFVVGYGQTSGGTLTLFRWSQQQGFLALGNLPGYSFSEARALSDDGAIIAGNAGQGGGSSRRVSLEGRVRDGSPSGLAGRLGYKYCWMDQLDLAGYVSGRHCYSWRWNKSSRSCCGMDCHHSRYVFPTAASWLQRQSNNRRRSLGRHIHRHLDRRDHQPLLELWRWHNNQHYRHQLGTHLQRDEFV